MEYSVQENPELDINLGFGSIIKNSIAIGLKNLFPLFINTLFWLLTIWIPYLNVGTTIGMSVIVLSLSKGTRISFTEIFNPSYRKYMGEYFILMGLKTGAISFGFLLIIFPAIVIKLAFSQATFLIFDKKIDPLSAIKGSNEITYGYKWRMFFAPIVVNSVIGIVLGLFFLLLTAIATDTGSATFALLYVLLGFIAILLFLPVNMGTSAYIYRELSKRFSS